MLTDFIEACNLLQLKATITCERKLVFDKVQKTSTFSAKATSTPVAAPAATVTKQSNLDSLIADLEQDDNADTIDTMDTVEYSLKHEHSEETGQILEVYEISNIEDAEITYEDAEDAEDISEERYELLNVISDSKSDSVFVPQEKKRRTKVCNSQISVMKPRTPAKNVDEDTLNKAIKEVISNSSR